ncbi:MAG: chromate transporter, partial [Clostridia bacterium]|nr:chromate transporter [Clostridia bacterium]
RKVFGGIRPAAIGLILSAGFSVFLIALFPGYESLHGLLAHFDWKCALLFAVIMAATQVPKFKKLHPLVYIAAAAAIGIVFHF